MRVAGSLRKPGLEAMLLAQCPNYTIDFPWWRCHCFPHLGKGPHSFPLWCRHWTSILLSLLPPSPGWMLHNTCCLRPLVSELKPLMSESDCEGLTSHTWDTTARERPITDFYLEDGVIISGEVSKHQKVFTVARGHYFKQVLHCKQAIPPYYQALPDVWGGIQRDSLPFGQIKLFSVGSKDMPAPFNTTGMRQQCANREVLVQYQIISL